MSAFAQILADNNSMNVALFAEGGMFLEGKVIECDGQTVTLEMNITAQRQAFSGGEDLKRQTLIHATVLTEKIIRVDRIASKK